MRHVFFACIAAASLAAPARGHEGHGLAGTHGHATDVVGFIVAAVCIGAILWQQGRK